MKICMVTTFYPPFHLGGDGVLIQRLASGLARAGHEVHVIHDLDACRVKGIPVPSDTPPRDVLDGVRVHRLRRGLVSSVLIQQTGRPLLKAAALRRILDGGFDLINFHNISLVGGPGVLPLGRAAKIFTLHEHWWVCPTHILWKYTGELCTKPQCLRCCLAQATPPQAWRRARRWMARCLGSVDLVLAPSRFTAGRYQAWMDDNGVQLPVEILPGCAPPPAPAAEPPGGLPERYFLYVGRLTAAKGILELADLCARHPDWQLVVVGEGEARGELERRGLRGVQLMGWLDGDRLSACYARAEALVFPSLCAETFGLTAAEALAHGTPVVARRAGGVEDVVAPEVGFVCDSLGQMEAALARLWNEPGLRGPLGERGRRRYRELYTPEAYVNGYLAAVGRARERFSRRT